MFVLFALASLADPSTEVLERPALPGFVIGHQQTAGGASIQEEIPEGETVLKRSRMVTVQRFPGMNGRVTAARFAEVLGQSAAASCAGATASPLREDASGATVRMDCPNNPATGLPETFIAKAVLGRTDLHVVQVAWRRVPSAADVGWGEAYLKAVRLKP